DLFATQSLDRPAHSPGLPFPDRREIFVLRSARQCLGAQLALRRCPESRRHRSPLKLLARARTYRRPDLSDGSSGSKVRDRTLACSGAHEICRKGGVHVRALPPSAIVTSTRCRRALARSGPDRQTPANPELAASRSRLHSVSKGDG